MMLIMDKPIVSPELKEYLDNHPAIHPLPTPTAGTCTNCSGTGRHIYVDTDGKMKDIPCSACTGGQTANQL